MFVDLIKVKLVAGSGGNGITAFRREKYESMGGPYGGNGGRGGNIIFKVDTGLKTLLDLKFQRIVKAPKGQNGGGKNMHGKNGEDLIVKVPQGTVVTDLDTNLIVADLSSIDDEIIVANGGRGGRGNSAFRTHENPAPSYSENGEPGEERYLQIELKLIADVGLVGMPSVGKSTILSQVTRSTPKIAAYHFTTLSPNLGVVNTKDNDSFVLADLPGLIENASQGEGLGDQFLRHVERTKIIAHVIDMGSQEGRDPYLDYVLINKELSAYSKKLIQKPTIIIANKSDLEGFEENLKNFKTKVDLPIYPVSGLNNTGLDEVMLKLAELVKETENNPLYEEDQFETHVLYKFKAEKPYEIIKIKDNTWEIISDEIVKLFGMNKFDSQEGIIRFARRLRNMGVDDTLRELGAVEGDTVTIKGVKDFTFDYKL